MRYEKWPRPVGFSDTNRKRLAFARRQRLEREALPLFADLVAASQPSADAEMTRRAAALETWNANVRDARARRWRQGRSKLAALDGDMRSVVVDLWMTCPYPAHPERLLGLLYDIEIGRTDPHRPPWRLTEQELIEGRARMQAFIEKRRESA